jgi:uncharacterized membrane protein YjjB (DUF3815 family)
MLEIIFAVISGFISYLFLEIFIGIMILIPGNFIADLFIRRTKQDKLKQGESRSYHVISISSGLLFWVAIGAIAYRLSH